MQGETERGTATLELNHNEERILARLTQQGYLAREQVCAIATCGHRPVKLGSVGVIVRELRKKLATQDIQLATIRDFGFGLRQEDREKVLGFIALPRKGREKVFKLFAKSIANEGVSTSQRKPAREFSKEGVILESPKRSKIARWSPKDLSRRELCLSKLP